MIGSVRWNMTAACIGIAGTFLMSFPDNVLTTALIRSLYSGFFLFVLAFPFRWLLGVLVRAGTGAYALGANTDADAGAGEQTDLQDIPITADSGKGRNVDWATPADDGLPGAMRPVTGSAGYEQGEPEDKAFAPLRPPKLTTRKDLNPEELAQAMRRMTED